MRPIDERYVRALDEAKGYKPFPGRHPLRLWWACDGQSYIGRPSRTAIQRLRNLAFNGRKRRPYKVAVFDRAGLVVAADQKQIRTVDTVRYYLPWSQIDAGFAFFDRFFFKKLGRWHIYSPYPVLKKSRVDDFKKMMNAATAGASV